MQDKIIGGAMEQLKDDALEHTLVSHSHKFDEILVAVVDNENTIDPKIDALQIHMNLLRHDHRKLRDRVEIMESTLASIRPIVSDTTAHLKALQAEVHHLWQHAEDE
ncbi:hypothetical protein NDU88_003853 [Pleurodeles waltl]|uniref:Uncharacterized protein n=1 Tax=Pleurodeles waltl TaxID=8319 RepID=A0AAV7WWG8_PLEWA|nr:hypothetical protein NDU88_003853 [Pleurodeles waltl]